MTSPLTSDILTPDILTRTPHSHRYHSRSHPRRTVSPRTPRPPRLAELIDCTIPRTGRSPIGSRTFTTSCWISSTNIPINSAGHATSPFVLPMDHALLSELSAHSPKPIRQPYASSATASFRPSKAAASPPKPPRPSSNISATTIASSSIIAHTFPSLLGSIRVMEKCGLTFEGEGEEAGTIRYQSYI